MKAINRIPGWSKDLLMLAAMYLGQYEIDPDCDGIIHYHYWMGFTMKQVSYESMFYGHGLYVDLFTHDKSGFVVWLNKKIKQFLGFKKHVSKFYKCVKILAFPWIVKQPNLIKVAWKVTKGV